jgi:hypothetical protein
VKLAAKKMPNAEYADTKAAPGVPPPGVPPVNGTPPSAGKAAADKADKSESASPQFTSLVSKLLELADVSVGLGINVVSLLTAFAKNQAGGAATVPPQATRAAEPPQPGPAADSGAPRNYCIVNRMPIHPGSSVKVSFSINNDTPDAVKNLALSCREFVGAAQGFAIADNLFSVEPAAAAIGPLDFERFLLKGTMPVEAPADSYNGWIVVAGDEQMRIPAVLLITSQTG